MSVFLPIFEATVSIVSVVNGEIVIDSCVRRLCGPCNQLVPGGLVFRNCGF